MLKHSHGAHPLLCLLLIHLFMAELRIMGGSEILMASQHGNKHGTLAIEPVSTRQGTWWKSMLRIRIRIHRIHMFLGLLDPDPDPLVRGMDPDPDPVLDFSSL
jgi:hypothetical protein